MNHIQIKNRVIEQIIKKTTHATYTWMLDDVWYQIYTLNASIRQKVDSHTVVSQSLWDERSPFVLNATSLTRR